MTSFSVRNRSAATVEAPREDIWAALTDPDLLPRLTPYLARIDADGNRWVWHLRRIPVLSTAVNPSFTEVMGFDEPSSITFHHDEGQSHEQAAVEGEYHLADGHRGTRLSIDLAITVDLPFPRLARVGVETAMKGVVLTMGRRFSSNLVSHLGS